MTVAYEDFIFVYLLQVVSKRLLGLVRFPGRLFVSFFPSGSLRLADLQLKVNKTLNVKTLPSLQRPRWTRGKHFNNQKLSTARSRTH